MLYYEKDLSFSKNIFLPNGERLHHFTLRYGTRQGYPLLSSPFNMIQSLSQCDKTKIRNGI